jgi:soluble lytic murein transglycosylase-like protein
MLCKGPLLLLAVPICVLALVTPADADLVVLTSGRTFAVKAHRVEGEELVLSLRGGGEIRCPRALVERILPDELPDPEEALEPEAEPDDVPARAPMPATPFGEIILSMAEAHGVDPMLVRAVIQVESNYRPTARSHKGAMGLMQLMPATARQYGLRNPYDPTANIAAGVQHLKALLDRWGVVELALAAYNAGEGAVQKFNGIPPYRETRTYVTRVLALAGLR